MKYLKRYKVFESNDFYSDVEPDGLEEQISFYMKWYPSLYDSKFGRIKVLAHMYLSYGTGFKWVLGELVNTLGDQTDKDMYEYRRERWLMKRADGLKRIQQLQKDWDEMNDIIEFSSGESSKYLSRIQDEIDELQDEIDNFNPYGKEYKDEKPFALENIHISDYSPIFHIPDDCKPDYLEGAKEIVSYIISIGYDNEDINKVAKKLGII